MNRNWLVLTRNYRTEVAAVLESAGEEVLSELFEDAEWMGLGYLPDAVVLDHDANRPAAVVAAYLRGRGVPVVYLTSREGKGMYRQLHYVIGCWVIQVNEFADWLASDPQYLYMPPNEVRK